MKSNNLLDLIEEAEHRGAYEFEVSGRGDFLKFFHGQWYVNGKETDQISIDWFLRTGWTLRVTAASGDKRSA